MSDFSDNSSELDKYGVWVKKSTSANEDKQVPPVEEPVVDETFITQSAATDLEIQQDLADFDIDSLGETPVIEEPLINETSVEESSIEETVSDGLSADDFTTESVPEDFTTESIPDDFSTSTPEIEEPQITEETSVSSDELSLDDFAIDSINDDNGPMTFEAEPTPPAEETAEVPETPATEEVSFEDGEIDLDAFMNDDSAVAPAADSTQDGEVDLSSFMDDSSAPSGDGEIDLSAFMGDGGDSPDFGNGDIDLEAFMGSEGFASDKQEQEEIEDTDPLDIDLDFEENESLELQDAEANGDISGIEQAPSFTGNTTEVEIEDFDALFDDIVDETPQDQIKASEPVPTTEASGSTEEIDLSDFGFTDDSDNQNPVLGDGSSEPKKQGPVDYEMNVDDDDSPTEDSEVVTEQVIEEDDNSDDIEVDITQDNEASVQKAQKTDLSSPDDSFDIDSIFDNIEDESGETVSFGSSSSPANFETETITEENSPAPSEEVTDNQPMFQEPQESDFGEAFEEPKVEENFVIDEPVIEENFIEENEVSTEDFTEADAPAEENEIDIPVFDDPTIVNASEEKTEESETAMDETSFEEPVIDSSFIEEPVIEETVAEETPVEENSIDLVDFMGEEGFTDGGPGVQGYDTIASGNNQEPEEASDEPVIDEPVVFEEPTIDETAIEEPEVFEESASEEQTLDETAVFEEPSIGESTSDETTIEEPAVEEPTIDIESSFTNEESEKSIVETSEEIGYNEENMSEESDISLDDFMGEEGFTDGGPGVQGYDTVASNDTQEMEETDNEETNEEVSGFEESAIPDTMEAPESTESDEDESMDDITAENEANVEPDYSNISAFADKKPDYDMTGVTLTLDDFGNIKEYPETPAEESVSVIDEPAVEETSVSESDAFEDQPDTYSVFIKTESSSGQAENAGAVSEGNDITTDETVAEEAAVSAEETMDSFDSTSVLSKISEELASLRTEIKDLKSEFEEIKKNGIQSEDSLYEEADSPVDEMTESVEIPRSEEDTGFFNDTDEDDTIALSGDELSNILSTAEFTSKTEESLDDGLKMDFESEELEEPVFDESVMNLTESEDGDEISAPTVDDVLVESSSSDLMDNTISTADDGEEEIISEDDIPAPTLESLELPAYEQEEEITDENIEFLKDDNVEDTEEDENLETGISEQPVETVFNNWNAATEPEEPIIEEPVIEEPIIEETSVGEEEISEPSSSDSNEIPASMKEEIKSVLSYMDQLLENLPEDKIAEFAQSEQFETYKKLFNELGLS